MSDPETIGQYHKTWYNIGIHSATFLFFLNFCPFFIFTFCHQGPHDQTLVTYLHFILLIVSGFLCVCVCGGEGGGGRARKGDWQNSSNLHIPFQSFYLRYIYDDIIIFDNVWSRTYGNSLATSVWASQPSVWASQPFVRAEFEIQFSATLGLFNDAVLYRSLSLSAKKKKKVAEAEDQTTTLQNT